MEVGNFSKRTLLTGAGWSHNWGARLAADVWQLVMDHSEVAGNERLRALLLEEGSFEGALAKTYLFVESATNASSRLLDTSGLGDLPR